MADLPPAETARLDQTYTRMSNAVDALVRDSRVLLDELGPEHAALTLAKGIDRQALSPCTLASYLAIAIVRLQRGEGHEVP
ncbi:MAG: hypothetical protein HOQ21_10035 [Dermatophilaceae bacterium]|nr:hypothetical protein [Dermatophilaceae bacterium]